MKLTNSQLIYICQQLENGNAANALATADLYLSKNCPIRKALAQKAAPYLIAETARKNRKGNATAIDSIAHIKNAEMFAKRSRFQVLLNPNLRSRRKIAGRRSTPKRHHYLRTLKFEGLTPRRGKVRSRPRNLRLYNVLFSIAPLS